MKDIFGKSVSNQVKSQISQIDENEIPYVSTKKGICLGLLRGLSVSSSGDRIWGIQTIDKKCGCYKIIAYNFKSRREFLYDYESQSKLICVLAAEDFDLLMSGGYDLTVVLHNLTTGKVIKKWQINYEFISCFFRVDKVVAVGVSNKVFLLT